MTDILGDVEPGLSLVLSRFVWRYPAETLKYPFFI